MNASANSRLFDSVYWVILFASESKPNIMKKHLLVQRTIYLATKITLLPNDLPWFPKKGNSRSCFHSLTTIYVHSVSQLTDSNRTKLLTSNRKSANLERRFLTVFWYIRSTIRIEYLINITTTICLDVILIHYSTRMHSKKKKIPHLGNRKKTVKCVPHPFDM